jgi:predicted LPLAT superfamily acyltransferase
VKKAPSDTSPAAPQAEWIATAERGSSHLLSLAVWCVRKFGGTSIRIFLLPVALYYFLFDARARRASQNYLIRVGASQPNASTIARGLQTCRHFYSFAEVILDRLVLWAGGEDQFEVAIHGREKVLDLVDQGRGAVMVGAHLGSFDVLRVLARQADIPVNVLMFGANAKQINAAFESLDPDARVRIIDIDPTSATAASMALRIRHYIEAGEFVASMADRVRPGSRDRIMEVDFLGGRAPLSEGPFLLAMVLEAPLLLTFALRTGPRRYEIFIEELSEGTQKVRGQERRKLLDGQIQAFAARLESFCRVAPLQWFNFYDFWSLPRK